MLVDLVQVVTDDGLRLDGVLQTPPTNAAAPRAIDAWLCLHGTGSNFYSSTLLSGLVPRLLPSGAAVLRVNTRGHDLATYIGSSSGRRLQGAAFERVDESPHDLQAWIGLLAERGYTKIGILGHSLGAVKAIYTLAQLNAPQVAALVAVSPPRLSHAHYCKSPKGSIFAETFARAEAHIKQGEGDALMSVTFPLAYIVSAAAYVDRYGREERYNVLSHAPNLRVPTLFTYGTKELQTDVAFNGMPEDFAALSAASESSQFAPLEVAVIAGADHMYTGVHDALASRVEQWVGRLA